MIKRITLAIIFLTVNYYLVSAQAIKIATGNGVQLTNKYTDVEGSPFLTPNWVSGIVKFKNGNTDKDMMLKLDQVEQRLLFKNTNDSALAFVDPVAEFKLFYVAGDQSHYQYFRTGYGDNPYDYYEVLADGTAQLLKLTKKTIKENRPYGSATTQKTIDDNTEYFIFKDGKLTKLSRNKKAILALLGTKTTEVDTYIKTNNLNIKQDTDLAKIILYYNSI